MNMKDNTILKSSKYLGVTYSITRAPHTDYPFQLCQLLLLKYFKKTGKLLEMGCGRGDHLKVFSELGFDVAGVDISPSAPEYSDGYDVKVANLEADPLPFPKESFDFVFSKSVIEHMREPAQLMAKAFDVLRPGGIAVMMTPSWEHTSWGPFYIDHTHVTPFTAPALEDALKIVGFGNIEVEHFYQLPFLWKCSFLKPFVRAFAAVPIPYRPYKKAPWPDGLNKFIRFSKEVMLLAAAQKPTNQI
jgi:SAM-dependent methyltransferase